MATDLELNFPLAPPWPLRRFSVEQYHQMGELGLLTPEDNVELIEGWIVEKMNQRPIHGFIVRLLSELFMRDLPPGWLCQCQLPIAAERSEPEPDIAIIRGSHVDFHDHHPSGSVCRLVIEVADTSLDKDRAKASIYREAGVQEYWIINVKEKCLERYQFSSPSSSTPSTIIKSDSKISLNFDEVEIGLALQQIFL